MNYWLVKSEPETFSIDDLKKEKTTYWDAVRNYQARNFLCEMKISDPVLFYHSNAEPSGIVGLAEVSKLAIAEALQFDPNSEYFDPKASAEKPRWFSPQIKFVKKFPRLISLAELKQEKSLSGMQLLSPGNRLSVMPLSKSEFELIGELVRK